MKKTVLITGSSTGIGRATVFYFQQRGWNVAATMRTPAKEKELGQLPGVTATSLVGVYRRAKAGFEPSAEGAKALRRFATLVPIERAGELGPFLEVPNRLTVQAVFQSLTNICTNGPPPQDLALGPLLSRVQELALQALDPTHGRDAAQGALAASAFCAAVALQTPGLDALEARLIERGWPGLVDVICGLLREIASRWPPKDAAAVEHLASRVRSAV